MKKNHYLWASLLIAASLVSAVAAEEDSTDATNLLNRLTFSARIGFNISAKFKGFSVVPPAPVSRSTPAQPGRPNGDPYNYNDGYVLTDTSGNAGGETWYWGYDNSASQISGNTILFNRSTLAGSASKSLDSGPYFGGELNYSRELGAGDKWHWGFEAAVNYMTIGVHDKGSLTYATDAYAFEPGTTPPDATPSSPYQGSYEGPGFLLGDTPVTSTTTTIGRRKFDADIWGLRLGPYFERPLSERVNLSLSGGLAVGLLDGSGSWTQTVSVTGGGTTRTTTRGSDFDTAWGAYSSATMSYQFSERWSAVGGAQFQYLGKHKFSFKGQKVELDLSQSVFVTLGLTYSF